MVDRQKRKRGDLGANSALGGGYVWFEEGGGRQRLGFPSPGLSRRRSRRAQLLSFQEATPSRQEERLRRHGLGGFRDFKPELGNGGCDSF